MHDSPSKSLVLAFALALVAELGCTAHAQPSGRDRRGADRVDVDATQKIRAYTTDPSFLTEWVDHLPASNRVPSPPAFLGYVIGAPDELSQPDKINDYFRALARASDRVQVFSLGKSHGGREMIVAAIAEPRHLRRLDAIVAVNRQLADPRNTTAERASRLARSVPPIYWLTAGLHSPETGPPEMVMELAYRLAVSEQPHIREIRGGVVTLITPVLEMDGRARMVDWYHRYLTKVADLEDSPPRMAPYWGDYTAHDNNRDGLQLSQPLTRNFVAGYHRFLPVATLDLHESVPLLYVSTGTGPYNDAIDPIAVTEWQWFANYEVSQATRLGLRGVWTWGFYTGWYPGYLLWVANNHHSVGRFFETFGNGHPGTFERELHDSKYAGERVNARQWYRAWPPEKKLRWSLRNNTNYMQTGALASLLLVARNGDTLLESFWRKHHNAWQRGRTLAPHAFAIPAAQRDRGALHHLLWLLREHRIEVHRAGGAATLRGAKRKHTVELAAGDYLVRLDQPYGNFARTLLDAQAFPKSAPHTPYDDVSWQLGLMLGVNVQRIDDPRVFDVPATPLAELPPLPGSADQGTRWIVRHAGQAAIASLRWGLAARNPNARVTALAEPWQGYPRGSLVIEGARQRDMDELTASMRLEAVALAAAPGAATVEVDVPRVALFHTWRYTQDSGWARYALEQLGIPYTLINKDHLRRGGLRDRFDVIVVPSQGRLSFQDMVHGIDPKWGPMPYTRTEAFPSHGVIDSSEDITGGMGFAGLANLQEFVTRGGVMIGLGSGGLLASESGIARELRATTNTRTPGSHVTVKVLRPEHPIAWGYDEVTHVFRGNLPVYDVRDYQRGMAVMQFGVKTWDQADREADSKDDVRQADTLTPRAGAGAPGDDEDEDGGNDGNGDDDGDDGDGDDGTDASSNRDGAGPHSARKRALLLSGSLPKPAELSRKPAVLDVPVGAGRVIAMSWNPLHRYQNHHDFGLFTNALLFFNDFPETPTAEQMRRRERARPR